MAGTSWASIGISSCSDGIDQNLPADPTIRKCSKSETARAQNSVRFGARRMAHHRASGWGEIKAAICRDTSNTVTLPSARIINRPSASQRTAWV